MASKVSTFVLGHGVHRISCNHSNSSMPFHSLRCVPISCKARDKSFSSHPRRQQAKKLSPDRSLLNITSQQVAEENTKDRNANSSSVSKFLLENKSDADPPMNVSLQLISDVNTDDRDANSNDIAKFHLEAGSNGEIDDHPSISTPDGEDFDDSKFLGETESFLTKYTKDAEQLSNIQLEDLVGMMRNAEQNIMLLNQARVHALEDLDKILCEKGDLQGQINILETRLAETDARLKVAAQEKVYVEILENRLQKFKSELYESDVTDGCKYERFENSNMIPNEGASLSLSTSFMSLRDQLSLLRDESMSFREDIHTLKDELAEVKETDNSRVLSLEKELSLFQSSLKEVQYTLAVAQKDVSELSALKLECQTLWQKVENLQELYEKASTQADQSISVLPQNHDLWKKVHRLEDLLEEARSHEFLSEKAQQYNDLLQQKILSLEERLETSYKEIHTHVQLYQESVQEFQDTLYSLKKGSEGNLSTELLEEMPWDFWSRILLNLDGWLLEKKISSNDAKLLREMTWKREGRIRDAYLSCKEKSESEAISTFLKLTSSRTSPGLHVIHIAAEMAPVAKVGGLGDVVCGLSKALQKKGHLVEVVLPKYDCMQCERIGDLKALDVVIESYFDGQLFKNKIWTGTIEGIPVYFIEPLHPARFFNRGNFYGEQDDFKRFSFFSRAALELLLQAGKKPDIIHCHEWQTAFIGPLYWDLYAPRGLNSARICFTCHNFEYQGKAPASELSACGLDVHQLNRPDRMQDNFEHDKVNPVKGAVVFANIVTTVSPTYAQEVLAPEGGQGLQGTLNYHSKKFVGVLNGIDTEAWNPSTDSFLRFQYSAEDLQGKMENKDMVRKHLKLSYADATRPLVGCITRLVPQKGVHLIRHAIYRTLELGGQFVLLGSSPVPHIQREFEGIAKDFQNHPHIRLILKYDEALSHCIYAATDMFIIPSIFEPCGLTQMIAMRYGSIPIARKTGGLNDSVFDIDDGMVPVQFRNGFTFLTANEKGLNNALERAFNCYNKNRENWQQLVRNNMKIDFSWDSSSAQYEELYEKSIARGRAAAATRQ